MKNFKKFLLAISIFAFFILAVSTFLQIIHNKDDYARLEIRGKYNNSVFLNDNDEYVYMPYYGYKSEPDLEIRNGKNFVLSLFGKNFGAYSDDEERNYLFCNEGGFGVQVFGLYIKKNSLENLFEPTKDNISKIVITEDYDNVVLEITPDDEECFNFFIKTYNEELNDFYFPIYSENMGDFNGKYRIDIEYQNGDISRFLKCISEIQLDAIYKYY
ncbi:MAG: hypothetical protein J1F24_04975 [Oscillospiraceae bacterium]|nr:hypothetical protein [Oscillospiraceae bacterium]